MFDVQNVSTRRRAISRGHRELRGYGDSQPMLEATDCCILDVNVALVQQALDCDQDLTERASPGSLPAGVSFASMTDVFCGRLPCSRSTV